MKTHFTWKTAVPFVVILFLFTILFFQTPLLLKPLNTDVIEHPILFRWISLSEENELIIDNAPGFTSPIFDKVIVGKHYYVNVPFTQEKYYWKIISKDKGKDSESVIGSFYYQSKIAIRDEFEQGVYTLNNTGNTPVRATGSLITGAVVLDIGEHLEKKTNISANYQVEQA